MTEKELQELNELFFGSENGETVILKNPYKKIMKHICDGCCDFDCPRGKKNKLECIRSKKRSEKA